MIFDVSNPPLGPDSDLDPDLSLETAFTIGGSRSVMIAPGDWVDVDPSVISADPEWGFSFQVSNVYPDAMAVGILVWNSIDRVYMESQFDAVSITNNFRRLA